MKNSNETDQEIFTRSNKRLRGFIILLLIVSAIWGISWYLVIHLLPDWQSRSSFGEMFGAVNAFFSGAALAGVIYAIILQRRELELQRHELEMTRQELRRSAEAQEKSEKALAEQAEALALTAKLQEKSQAALSQQAEAQALTAKLNALRFLPTLTCSFHLEDSKVFFTVLNLGDTPAFDVDVLIVGNYHEDDIDIPTFINRYVVRDPEEAKFNVTEDGFYGVFDRLVYSVLPQRRKIVAQIGFPAPPIGIYSLFQFRDLQGNNYYQLYWFFPKPQEDEVKVYRLGSIHPITPHQFSKIESDSNRDLTTEDKSLLPEFIQGEFLPFWKASISSVFTESEMADIEDRGEWHDV